MCELFYRGRPIVLDSPVGVVELTRRLELAFDGTVERPPAAASADSGNRRGVALIAGTVAAVASPEIPVVGGSPLLVGVLAMAAVAFVFALLGSIEARTSTRLLVNLTEAHRRSPS